MENNNKNLVRELEELGRKYNELVNNVRNKFEVEATRTISTLEQNFALSKR
jgi:hypothetical protein